MSNTSLHFSSATDDWATPSEFFDKLNKEFHFDLDVCASPENAKCKQFFSKMEDGLSQIWEGTVWMNPPYGREIGKWVSKAYESGVSGATVVCLLPARTDTHWWHKYCTKGEIFFIQGRLKFGGAVHNAPFPSAVVVFRPTVARALTTTDHVIYHDSSVAA